ncbi:MAG: hypothetical protein JST30_01835 [Armatimonadetes bacterium]|nr:hypothetical protein [Armatimonadota bacterium]
MKKKPTPVLATFVAATMALAALATSLVNGVDPATCTLRGGAAFLIGRILASVWCALLPSENVGMEGGLEPGLADAAETDEEPLAA